MAIVGPVRSALCRAMLAFKASRAFATDFVTLCENCHTTAKQMIWALDQNVASCSPPESPERRRVRQLAGGGGEDDARADS
eukprot:scaffold48_cov311-Pinguiococcus_pyrenoidosus.AAC.238